MFILSLEKNQMNKKWKKFVNEAKLRVFDFDDTIVKTDAKIGVTSPSGEQFMMTPKEFAVHQMDPENKYDFSEFNSVINPREVTQITNILRNVLSAGGEREVVILTARDPESQESIKQYLENIGIDHEKIEIVLLASSDPLSKSNWIENKIVDGVTDVLFLDDSGKNIKAVQDLKNQYPDVKIDARVVRYAEQL
tara:strand:+ start:2465 stop:3046 length:582 start_codon:yes stop_codon:yes gene_type:complete